MGEFSKSTFFRRCSTSFTIITKRKTTKNQGNSNSVNEDKFSVYFDFKTSNKHIKPHQILAINRGEALKILSVKIEVPDYVYNKFFHFCLSQWRNVGKFNPNRNKILELALKDSYTRLVQPLIIREVRAELKSKAEKASYEVFATNLKQLLLMPPVKGKPILGIDPGYANGCKLAVISETGSVLATDVVYPHRNKGPRGGGDIIKNLLKNFNCHLVAVGNGTACRETESWLSDLIQKNSLDATYTIINEAGASIYSCSVEAKKEFPSLDPNLISAVSLARRVQEPLAELVKVEPKHIGVGMYQHDLPKKQLEQALDEVVTECVSFVGVDLNTASQCLLRRIAGLTDNRASKIIEYREKHGQFCSRAELLKIKGIGAKVFEQCAGFLRVGPVSMEQAERFYKKSSTEKLDCTYIHPESYDLAKKLIKELKLNYHEVGQQHFRDALKSESSSFDIAELSASLDAPVQTINLILDALSKPLNFDLRSECAQAPLFKKGLTSMQDLQTGSVLTGSVNNVTHFGCFVDVGVGTNGLIHGSHMNGFKLHIGDRVEVKVLNVEIERRRIGLQMVNKIS